MGAAAAHGRAEGARVAAHIRRLTQLTAGRSSQLTEVLDGDGRARVIYDVVRGEGLKNI